jgi:hypothetical protein
LDNFPKWCERFNAKLLTIEIWKNEYLLTSRKFDLRQTWKKLKNLDSKCGEESSLETSINVRIEKFGIEEKNTSINVSLFNRNLRYYRQLNNVYPRWCNHENAKFINQSNNFGKINFDRKSKVTELQVNDYWKMKKTKRKIECLSNELCKLKKSIEEIKFRNEPWNWIVRKASVIISKVTCWIKSYLMWKKIRGSNDRMRIFDTSPPISFLKQFNTAVIALQEEFTEAKEDPMKYLLDEGIKQMTRQHLGFRLEGGNQSVKKKISKIKVSLPFFSTLMISELMMVHCLFAKFQVLKFISRRITLICTSRKILPNDSLKQKFMLLKIIRNLVETVIMLKD